MRTEKRRVRLADVRPDPNNPRDDMGDIALLAGSIEATGGEPLSPPVVVEDGGAYRIVDGERRYRAMLSLGADEMDVLVCPDMYDASCVVAMVATDDKRPLTEAERAKGVQQMLVLGVPEERAAKAARTDAAKVRAVRRVAKEARELGVQAGIDQLAAADTMPSDKERRKVLEADPGQWQAVAARLDAQRAAREAKAELLAAIGARGLEVLKEPPDGMRFLSCVGSAADVERVPDGCVVVDRPYGMSAYRPADGEEAARDADEAERLAAVEENASAVRASGLSMARHVGALIGRDPSSRALDGLREKALGRRRRLGDEMAEALGARAAEADPGAFELADAAAAAFSLSGMYNSWSCELNRWRCSGYADAYQLARSCGWEPSAADEELMALALEGSREDGEEG